MSLSPHRPPTDEVLENEALEILTTPGRVPDDPQSFQSFWGVAPADFAKISQNGHYFLPYGGPFHLPMTLTYLGRDKNNAAERVEGNRYTRFFPTSKGPARLALVMEETGVEIHPETGLAPSALLEAHRLVQRMLGLEQPVAAFMAKVADHPVMGPLARPLAGVHIPQVPSLFEGLCWAIVGQQINLAFAYRLRNRLIRLGNGLPADAQSGNSLPDAGEGAGSEGEMKEKEDILPFPSPEQVAALTPETLLAHQFSRQKAQYLGNLAQAFLEGTIVPHQVEAMEEGEAEETLMGVKGVGRWSAAYALMRALGKMDRVPVGDAGLKNALKKHFSLPQAPTPDQQEQMLSPFRPYRSLAVYYLWKSL